MACAKRIYISGPMTGIRDFNFPAFNAEAKRLRGLGFDVVNPAELNLEPGKTYHQCLRTDIRELTTCDAIALLPGWAYSNGAKLERHVANALGLEVLNAYEINEYKEAA